ncbi:hypothetical protein LB465_12510 [Salegentibacter sp. LM13S]|uniref:YqiA/YcfP family alpha/beta fold hydrolase n=1 Tax=Salegentibacter lacus TaxID=2873599 RepID=UPI001CCFACFE|nr:YqiA/YcfP family alpha/beta fold hydrolase [Salegentibacter lacus]MBZ9631604.1 hypothetical protein [Salegentibacter lacus]
MNILYLHGLKSKLKEPKRKILEKYGQVFAPDIDYSTKHFQPETILKQFPTTEFNVVMGSSMGALNAYAVSEIIGRPALLFNPPLSKYQNVETKSKFTRGISTKQILLGGSDDIVNPAETLNFLSKNLQQSELDIQISPQLGHRIPIDIFTHQVKKFFKDICA